MKKLISLLMIAALLSPGAQAAKIQRQGIKTAAECVAAGSTAANCLPLDAQIWDATNGQQLSLSIANGQLGGGGGGKNYLASYVASTSGGTANTGNGDFELNATTGWSLAHSALTSLVPTSTASAGTPFDSTHGGSSASGNLSLSIESTSPIQKKYSGKLISSAASTAGDMLISSPFYIDSVDQTQPMTITLGSSVTAGAANLNFSGTSSNSFAIYVYDVTAGVWIQPAGVYGMVSSGLSNVKNVVFQPQSSTSTRYQLAFINVNASAGAYTLLLDAISVGPQAALSAPAMSDVVAFTPIWTNFAAGTQNLGYYRRVGDHMEVAVTATGTAPSGTVSLTVPNSQSVDLTKAPSSATVGTATAYAGTGSTISTGVSLIQNATTISFIGPANASWNATSPVTFGSGSAITAKFSIPIVGWSSNTVSSADSDTRVISARYTGTTSSIANTNAVVAYSTLAHDTSGSYNTSTGNYTVSTPGYYRLFGQIDINGTFAVNSNGIVWIYQNGSAVARGENFSFSPSQTDLVTSGTAVVQAKAGDTFQFQAQTSATAPTIANAPTLTYMTIERLSGPVVAQAAETIASRYTVSGSTSVPSGTATKIAFQTKDFDDHNLFTSSTTFTAQTSGKYLACGTINLTFGSNANANMTWQELLYKNGSQQSILAGTVYTGTLTVNGSRQSGCDTVRLLSGDFLEIYTTQNTSVTETVNDGNFSVTRIGNY